MKRIQFDAIPDCVGRMVSNVELNLSHPKPEKLKKILTVKNKGAAFKLKRAKESKGFNETKLATLSALGTVETDSVWIETKAKIDNADRLIPELESQLIERFYIENDDGTLAVPAGFWYLCESVRDNAHLNTEIAPFFLPGLRHYQQEGLAELYKYKRATVELATGLGKSKMIMSVALAGIKAGKRVMIIVPTEYLVGQVYKEMKALHANTTAVGGDFKHPKLGWNIMVITMASAPKYVDMAGLIILDEAHHSPAATWSELLSGASAASHVYNFTATAFRSDGLDMAIHSFGGPIVYARDARWGLDNKWLAPVSIIQVRIKPRWPEGKPMFFQDHIPATAVYRQGMSAANIQMFVRDKLLAGLGKGRRIMCIFRTVKFAEVFRKFCAGTPKFSVAHADKKKSKFPKLPLKHFNDRLTNLLVACDKLVSEGIDIPDSNLLIMATQHTSDVTTYQLIGRVLRNSPGKTGAVVLDIAIMGFAQYERAAASRLKVYKRLVDNVVEIEI